MTNYFDSFAKFDKNIIIKAAEDCIKDIIQTRENEYKKVFDKFYLQVVHYGFIFKKTVVLTTEKDMIKYIDSFFYDAKKYGSMYLNRENLLFSKRQYTTQEKVCRSLIELCKNSEEVYISRNDFSYIQDYIK